MFTIRLPSERQLQTLLHEKSRIPCETFQEIPVPAPRGFRDNIGQGLVGQGEQDFLAARQALQQWKMFPQSWLTAVPASPTLSVGNEVAVIARCGPCYVTNVCRITHVVDSPRHFSFIYSTLADHMLTGAEIFALDWQADDQICYRVHSIARPQHFLAVLGDLYVHHLQRTFAQQSPLCLAAAVKEFRSP